MENHSMAGLKINLLRIRGQKTTEALGGVQILSFPMDLSQINVPLEENLDQTASWGSGRESRGLQSWRCQSPAAGLVGWGFLAEGRSWLMWHLFLRWPVRRSWRWVDFREDGLVVRLARDRSGRNMDEQDAQGRINVDFVGGVTLFQQAYLIKPILSKPFDKALYHRSLEETKIQESFKSSFKSRE